MSSKGAMDVLAERQRQIEGENWTAEHDSQWDEGELANAAACYALTTENRKKIVGMGGETLREHLWPWDEMWWKPNKGGRRRQLVKAAALLLAELDRMDSIAAAEGGERGQA